MAESDPAFFDAKERCSSSKESSSDEEWSSAPASPSGIPASPIRNTSVVNDQDSPGCSHCSPGSPRQDTNTACAHNGESRKANVDTGSSQNITTSDFLATTSTSSKDLPHSTTPELSDLEALSVIIRTAKANMGPFNQKAYRHGNQTLEFFGQQPVPDQDSSGGTATSSTNQTTVNRHRVVVQGTVQNCPGADQCPECLEGRTAPVQSDGLTPLPGHVGTASGSTASKTGKTTVQTRKVTLGDMHHGLMQTTNPPSEDTKSHTKTKSEPETSINPWVVFECLTDRLRRKAAEQTVQHLSQKLDAYVLEEKETTNTTVATSTATGLPFLKEIQLVDMINGAKKTAERLRKSNEMTKASKPSTSSAAKLTGQATDIQQSFDKAGKETTAPAEASKEVKYTPAPEEQICTERSKIWADLLIQENRKARAKWLSETEEEYKIGPFEGASQFESIRDKKTIYEFIRAEEEARLKAKSEADPFDESLQTSIDYALKSPIPSNLTLPHSQKYSELLANPKFLQISKRSLKDWCIINAVTAKARRTGRQYLSLLRKATDLPVHAWNSALPPVWDSAAMKWIWQDFTKAERGEEAFTSKADSKQKADPSKDATEVQGGSEKTLDSSKDFPGVQEGSNEKEKEEAIPLTKTQKRAKARKEKRKAQREALDTPSVDTANQSTTIPEVPNINEASVSQRLPTTDTRTRAVTRDGRTYRVPAPPRVDLSTAVQLAELGQLRIHMCPAIGKQEAERLLKASRHFQRGIDKKNIGKEPHVITKFLMDVGMKPSEYEEVLELEEFLEMMKKIEGLDLNDPSSEGAEDITADAEKGKKWKGKGTDDATAINTTTTTFTYSLAVPPTPTSYPPPPRPLKASTTIPWALSLTPHQYASLRHPDTHTCLRALLLSTTHLLTSAAKNLTGEMFSRLTSPTTQALSAMDLPPAKYSCARTILLSNSLRHSHLRYLAAAKAAKSSAGEGAIADPTSAALSALATKYPDLPTLLRRARARQSSSGPAAVDLFAASAHEAPIRPSDGPAEFVAHARAALRAEEARVVELVGETVEGVGRFVAEWPQLEGVVLGRVGRYLPGGSV